ncbi:helix-turn-helix transcriptional regulator [Kitasatospora sp. NPDC097691]|uniref:helix-turn-helix domain-containing protein n=1 Tax=Kitasatospora sp. NPDC097691 TaxID=3157231 RepID=UPI003327044A
MGTVQSSVRRRWLAAALVTLRQKAGKTPDEAAQRIGCHRSKISRIENARLGMSLGELRDLLAFYEVDDPDYVDDLLGLAARRREPDWLRRVIRIRPAYADLVAYGEMAESIRSFEGLMIPGLLQTPEYARALIGAGPRPPAREEIDALVTARLERQKILSMENPPQLAFVIGEAALRIAVGGAESMGRQLDHLMEMAQLPGIDLRVMPDNTGAHTGMFGPFVLFGFRTRVFSGSVVCLEYRAGTIYLEREDEVEIHMEEFEAIQSSALSPGSSLETIARVRQAQYC